MSGVLTSQTFSIETSALDRLMPMHICLSNAGIIIGAGPTLCKIFGDIPLIGNDFFDLFTVRRPGGVLSMVDLRRRSGKRLSIAPNLRLAQPCRGIALPLSNAGGMVINLSFGIGVIDAVTSYKLTDVDFAVTDLAMEMLYLVEAKTAVTDELRQLNLRLQGARDEAEEQALTDALTGLRNRRALNIALNRTIAQGVSFGLMHIDLDFFKAVNDTMGHAAGDFVLREVARALNEQTRRIDTVARVGGDEFVVVFEGITDPDQLVSIADRIVQILSEPLVFEGQSCRISASIGVTISSDYFPPDPQRMLSDADHALYASKNAGRGRAMLFAPRGGAAIAPE